MIVNANSVGIRNILQARIGSTDWREFTHNSIKKAMATMIFSENFSSKTMPDSPRKSRHSKVGDGKMNDLPCQLPEGFRWDGRSPALLNQTIIGDDETLDSSCVDIHVSQESISKYSPKRGVVGDICIDSPLRDIEMDLAASSNFLNTDVSNDENNNSFLAYSPVRVVSRDISWSKMDLLEMLNAGNADEKTLMKHASALPREVKSKVENGSTKPPMTRKKPRQPKQVGPIYPSTPTRPFVGDSCTLPVTLRKSPTRKIVGMLSLRNLCLGGIVAKESHFDWDIPNVEEDRTESSATECCVRSPTKYTSSRFSTPAFRSPNCLSRTFSSRRDNSSTSPTKRSMIRSLSVHVCGVKDVPVLD